MSLKSLIKPMAFGSAVVMGALASLGIASRSADADFSTAYCDGAAYATNIYRTGDPEAPGSELTMRIYSRADRTVFLNAPANRSPNPEGYAYSNRFGESQWEVFIPNHSDTCTLSRDGEVMDSGTVTMREPSSGD